MRLFRQIIDRGKQGIEALENSKTPPAYFILTFFFAINLRNFIEIFSDKTAPTFLLFSHYWLSYISLAILLILLFSIITNTDTGKTAKLVLPSFIILILAPIADLLLSRGEGFNITYLRPSLHSGLAQRFFTFFGDFPGYGITPGMRIEIAVVLLAAFLYFYIKKSNLIKALFGALLTYALIFLYCSSPFLARGIVESFGVGYWYSNLLMIDFYLLFIFLTGLLLAYATNGSYFKLVIKDIRPFRLAHYELMFLAGLIISMKIASPNEYAFTDSTVFGFMFTLIGIGFAWLYSVMINNIEDYEIDKISNKERPLVRSQITPAAYRRLSWGCLAAALFYASAAGFKTFFIILVFIANYFLYSAPPFRLKRVPLISKLLISVNSLILMLLGFLFITGSLEGFPKLFTVFFLVGFAAAINFIDIKDYEGDKEAGIKTLPVILGPKRAKLFIGLCFTAVYFSTYLALKNAYLTVPFFIFGIIQFFLINRRDYSERIVFLVYILSVTLFLYLYPSVS